MVTSKYGSAFLVPGVGLTTNHGNGVHRCNLYRPNHGGRTQSDRIERFKRWPGVCVLKESENGWVCHLVHVLRQVKEVRRGILASTTSTIRSDQLGSFASLYGSWPRNWIGRSWAGVAGLWRSSRRRACGTPCSVSRRLRRSVAGGRIWACGRARPRVEASYRGGFGLGRRVERAAEPTKARGVRCTVRARPGQVKHMEDGVCPSSSIRLAALDCLSQ